eukprot:CAMPEP_0184305994 /NCGR_PEP_ID=MMETSP1049-20130417/15108_1 /TAXON_ID=77928 /ORGANISM="Proteomonas sulcata, Strain CCMP704" /LENGTH=55 /DNA_ID=CAMNT_0026618159 /DNA_START=321 /DNA_END=488 /DNA_ORIENTATION=+
MFTDLGKKMKLVSGAKAVSSSEYKLFEQALKETPKGRWQPAHLKANGSDYAKMNI